jgi:hypothetical protein
LLDASRPIKEGPIVAKILVIVPSIAIALDLSSSGKESMVYAQSPGTKRGIMALTMKASGKKVLLKADKNREMKIEVEMT